MAAEATPLDPVESAGPGEQTFETSAAACRKSGLHGFTVRVLPRHPDLATPFVPGLITWAGAASGAASSAEPVPEGAKSGR